MSRFAAALLIIIPITLRAQAVPMPALAARQIGPVGFAGRVADVAMDPRAAGTLYVAFASGGVYRTDDEGATFDAIFDAAPVAGVGAMAVSPADSRVLWIGTGEATDRNDVSWGDGVYRSTDGGATWRNVGLASTRFIARIVPHPTDPNTAWVAAPGNLWAPSSDRGCYLTTDGGLTWRRMLAAPAPDDTLAGCGDVAVDPRDPRTVYAALYARRRTPWSFVAGRDATGGRDAGGIYRSRDGGATWTRLAGGLPANIGRIALAVAPSNPRVVYAQVQSEEPGAPQRRAANSPHGGVFRSDDGGDTWVRTSAMNPRPFYFSQLRVDPADENTIYLPGFVLLVSYDSGRSWSGGETQVVHEDLHALAIDPRNPKRLLLGSDGGPYLSRDGGAHWEFLDRMQTAQVYRLNVDDGRPYRVCVGTQDNGNWTGPSSTRSAEGITARDWRYVHGGDGADCFFDAREPQIVMTQSGTGWVTRVDLRSGAVAQPLTPKAEDGAPLRFNWITPMLASRWSADAFYLAGNRVFRGTRRGDAYAAISPDLSAGLAERAGGTGAETYGTVYALAESPLRRGMLWAATDDGKLWVTEDDGTAWSDLSARLPLEARGGFLTSVEAGHADARVAYLAMDGHRTGDFRPHLWRTADRGRSWTPIAGNLPADAPVKVVREDPANPEVLYAGTEHGLYATVDGGRTWAAIGGLPAVPVDALVLHPRELDLVVGTHGRGVYVIDDVRPLAQLTPAVRAQAAHLFPIRPATAFVPLPGWTERGGDGVLRGANPPPGALITYWIRPGVASDDSARLTVTDSTGKVVATLAGPGTPGLNRVSWDLGVQAPFGATSRALPGGEYTVTLAAGGVRQSQTVRVELAPGLEPPPE